MNGWSSAVPISQRPRRQPTLRELILQGFRLVRRDRGDGARLRPSVLETVPIQSRAVGAPRQGNAEELRHLQPRVPLAPRCPCRVQGNPRRRCGVVLDWTAAQPLVEPPTSPRRSARCETTKTTAIGMAATSVASATAGRDDLKRSESPTWIGCFLSSDRNT